jgi:hypothetical protein
MWFVLSNFDWNRIPYSWHKFSTTGCYLQMKQCIKNTMTHTHPPRCSSLNSNGYIRKRPLKKLPRVSWHGEPIVSLTSNSIVNPHRCKNRLIPHPHSRFTRIDVSNFGWDHSWNARLIICRIFLFFNGRIGPFKWVRWTIGPRVNEVDVPTKAHFAWIDHIVSKVDKQTNKQIW